MTQELEHRIARLEAEIARLKSGSSLQRINYPRYIHAVYTTTAGQSIESGGSGEAINFDTKVRDTHLAVTTGASWKFTAPLSSVYILSAVVRLAADAGWAIGETLSLTVYKDGAFSNSIGFYSSAGTVTPSTLAVGASGTQSLFLERGQYIHFNLYQNSGGTIALSTSSYLNYCSVLGLTG